MSNIQAEKLTKIYGSGGTAVTALNHVNINVREGEFVAIMGTQWMWQIHAFAPAWRVG